MSAVLNRRDRRERLAIARRRASWTWEDVPAPANLLPSWGTLLRATRNDFYSVQVYRLGSEWGEIVHLAIRRHDAHPDIPWAHRQRIKDEIAGSERTAIEVFPAAADLVDEANLYHLWVLPLDRSLPFTLRSRA